MMERVSQIYPELGIVNLKDRIHEGVRGIPRSHRDKPVVINVRHPLDLYISRYYFAGWETKLLSEGRAAGILEHYPDFPKIDFAQFLRLRNDWERVLPKTNSKKALLDVLIRKNIGSETNLLVGFLEENPKAFLEKFDGMMDEEIIRKFSRIHFLFCETLNKDLFNFFCNLGLDPNRLKFIVEHDKIRPRQGRTKWGGLHRFFRAQSRRTHWLEHFSEDELRWLAHRERLFFRLFPNRYGIQTKEIAGD